MGSSPTKQAAGHLTEHTTLWQAGQNSSADRIAATKLVPILFLFGCLRSYIAYSVVATSESSILRKLGPHSHA